jgi:hypothetical protein
MKNKPVMTSVSYQLRPIENIRGRFHICSVNGDRLFERVSQNRRDFLRIEAELSTAFAEIALTSQDPEKRKRNALNAKRGYDTILHFLEQEKRFDGDDLSSIQEMVATLKGKLDRLGQLPEDGS